MEEDADHQDSKSLDYALLCVVGLILVVSFFVLESATVTASAKYGVNFVLRQIAWTVVSILVFLLYFM